MVKKAEIEEAKEKLRAILKPGDVVYTQVLHVSRSGMSRVITTRIIKDGILIDIDYLISQATCLKIDKNHEGLKMGGCGMDMGFALVYQLSQTLYPGGYECIGEGCPSNDHFNGDRDYLPHKHQSGGYALKQRWL